VYSHPRFSAFATLLVVDEVGLAIMPDLVRMEIESKCAYLWLSSELDGVIAKLTRIDSFLRSNEQESIRFAHANFLDAFKLYHRLKILELVLQEEPEHETNFKELRQELNASMQKIKAILQKLLVHSRKVNSPKLNACAAQICSWFP
jgi:vacuolar-type H+-ATPase subunit I/STV1